MHEIILQHDGFEKYREALKEGSTVSLRAQQLIIQTLIVITSISMYFYHVIL